MTYQGIDLAALKAAAGPDLDAATSSERTRLLTVANLRKQKDFPTLFAACAESQLAGLNFHLKIAGETDGPEAEEIQRLPSSLGISDRVTFLGRRNDVPHLMASNDILVIASRWEGFPIVALEAAAIGIPIVATRVIDELFTDGVDCLMVDIGNARSLADAIRRLAHDWSLAEALSRNAKKLASSLGIDRAAVQLLTIYSQFARERSSRSNVPPSS